MKCVLKMISCILTVFILCSCTAYSLYDENGNNFYKDMNRAIEYSYPLEWSREVYEGDPCFYIRPNECDTAVEPFIFVSLAYNNGVDTSEGLDTYLADLEENFKEVEMITSGEGVDENNNSYRYYKYTYTDENGVKMYSTDRFVFLGQFLTVLVSGKCGVEDAELYEEDFNVTLDSMTYFS